MSKRLFQSIIHQLREPIGRTIGVIDESGMIIACSDPGIIGESRQAVKEEISYSTESLVSGGVTYRMGGQVGGTDCIVFVEGDDQEADRFCNILAISLGNLKNLYDDKYDRTSFIKNIIMDNILPSDIYIKSKEFHFSSEENRVVLLIKFLDKTDILPYEMIQGMFPDKTHDYVISVGEQHIVLIREISENYEIAEIEALASTIVDTMRGEFYTKVVVGISTVVSNLRDLAKAYKEAKIAIEVGKVFDTEKTIISYDNLGIGRLVYQLPTTLCEIFLQEVFKKGSLESLDRETLMTVQSFFENNLNVSETSRKLFVHRNTLVYRLEKIKKITGLDLREFDHAITFKVALMVKRYLTSKPTKF